MDRTPITQKELRRYGGNLAIVENSYGTKCGTIMTDSRSGPMPFFRKFSEDDNSWLGDTSFCKDDFVDIRVSEDNRIPGEWKYYVVSNNHFERQVNRV